MSSLLVLLEDRRTFSTGKLTGASEMRIAIVVLSLEIGGQERIVVRIARGLRERGHDAHVVCLSRGGALRGELGTIPIHDVVGRGGFDPALYPKLWTLFRRLEADVVHSHNAPALVYAVPAARAALVRTIVHTKHGNYRYPRRTLKLARVATRLVDHFVAVSDETARAAAQSERPRADRLKVVENGIPLSAFAPDVAARERVRDELGVPRDALVVGSVGRLVDDKDYPLLVHAMAPLLSDRVRLVVVGDGPARATIEAAIEPAKRPFVLLAGARRDVPRVLCAFDVFASSSRTEGLPLAIPEAMSTALPIVATAVGGVPGIVPGDVGRLVAHGDASAMRSAIRELLEDAPARTEMGVRARAYATARFGEDRMLDEYLVLYGG